MSMVGMIVDSIRKMEEAYKRVPTNLKKYSGARILYEPASLDGGNVGLKFESKRLRT